jgi:hypothetical protein
MKKIAQLRATLSQQSIMNIEAMKFIKGGDNGNGNNGNGNNHGDDDKRRERPGGGISNH